MSPSDRTTANLGRHHILPPYMLEHLAENGPEELREAVVTDLSIDRSLRATRVARPVAGFATAEDTEDTSPNRTVYDAHNLRQLPGTEVLREGGEPVSDVAVTEAYDGLGATFAFWWEVFGRNSIDGNGLPLDASVHYSRAYDNAFWDGEQMVFGDGDGQLFNRFTVSVDVIGHELAHGVTGAVRDLEYQGQSGALNESLSDVFGSLVKQYAADPKQTTEQADWLIGEGLLTSSVQGVALRSMKAPGTAYDDPNLGKDPQPATMADYVETTDDNGGVHINSGIPNRAFYLAAAGFGGYAWEKAGQIWFAALSSPDLTTTATFAEFAAATAEQAEELFGAEARTVVEGAWGEVGVEVGGAAPQEPGEGEVSGGVGQTDGETKVVDVTQAEADASAEANQI